MRKTSTIERQTMAAADVAAYLGVSLSGAYNMMKAVDFPAFRIGGRIMVTRAAFEAWLVEQQGKAV